MTRKQLRAAYAVAHRMYSQTHSRAWERRMRELNLQLMALSVGGKAGR